MTRLNDGGGVGGWQLRGVAALSLVVLLAVAGCPAASSTPDDRNDGIGVPAGGSGAVGGSAGSGGAGAVGGSAGLGGTGAVGGSAGEAGTSGSGGNSGASGASGSSGAGGDGGAGGALGPLTRDETLEDASVPLGEPLPNAAVGTWQYVELTNAKCRDGSNAGLYVRYSDKSTNFFVYLEGGGVCLNDFFCGINPRNVNETLNAESIVAGVTGRLAVKQMPGNDGIFKQDPKNPVADWNAVYVPYCTGDIWGGNKPNATFPPGFEGLGGHTAGMHQFVGFNTTSVILGRVAATFTEADKFLISGSSAGGIGALLNAHRMADTYRAMGSKARGFALSDSAVPFADQYLAKCTQQIWRDLWNLDPSFPSDCEGCFNADGGGIAKGMADYFKKKYPDSSQVIGGLISANDDEIIKLFYSAALPNCTPTSYGVGTYQAALEDFRDNIAGKDRFATYFLPTTFHMHLWRARFYETNGTSMSIADWLGKLLNNEAVHVSP